jgi:ABC-type bacteriocin/lantibiotic exporter with double-glycine peptidase domain
MQIIVGGAVSISATSVLMKATQPYVNNLLATDMHLNVGVAFHDHVQHLPVKFFDEHHSGEIASRFNDIRSSLRVVIMFLQTIATNAVYLFLVPPVLFAKQSRLAIIAGLTIPITGYLTYRQSILSYRNAKRNAEMQAEVQAFQTETFGNIRWLKGLSLEQYCYDKFKRMLGDLATLQRKIARTTRFYSSLSGLTRAVSASICMWFGWRLVIDGRLTLGQFIAFMVYLTYLHNPIAELVSTFSSIQETLVTFERVNDCLELPREDLVWLAPSPKRNADKVTPGDIELQDVMFTYLKSTPVLDRVNLVFRSGSINALIGPSGAGKTTLLRLLVAFYKPSAGIIKMGGTDISSIQLKDLRSRVSVVWQDAGLLSGSLWENLTLGATTPSQRHVNHIVELCQLDRFVASLSQGYATQIGERGTMLSAGQRQRLAIAQALLRDTPVILFDEATANIDLETEGRILGSVLSEFRDRLIIFATHRISAAVLADNVYMCNNGRVDDVTKSVKTTAINTNAIATSWPRLDSASLEGLGKGGNPVEALVLPRLDSI